MRVSLQVLLPTVEIKVIDRYHSQVKVELTSETVEISFRALLGRGEPGGASIVGLRLDALPKFLRRPMSPPALVGVADIGLSGPAVVGLLGPPQLGNSPSVPVTPEVDGR